MTTRSSLGLAIGILLATSCAKPETPVVTAKKTANGGDANASHPTLVLSWTPVSTVSGYHIFYVDPAKNVREIDSVQQGDSNFNAGTLTIDETNMEAWPNSGEKACFYVVAKSSGVSSDASDKACIKL